ncbi:MAG: DUF4445 domain-containing protein [Deltaproteobacteria bacterium]|nr:DUF4445 domain-containing protein [Deltaproteobacteria bacterium]
MEPTQKTDEKKGWIRAISVKITPPGLENNTGDVDRLLKELQKAFPGPDIVPKLALIKQAPAFLRKHGYEVDALLYEEDSRRVLFDLRPCSSRKGFYGLAVDLGTSTVVVRLVNLVSGEVEDETSFLNPQAEIGPDILTRIHYAGQPRGLKELKKLVLDGLNRAIHAVTQKKGISKGDVAGMAMAGNTTMTHLFLGLDPYWLCREPYIPVINTPPLCKASELGITIHPEAPVLIFPNVGSYFGGDLIAGLLASGMAEGEELSILVDVGTNAEVVLGNRDWLVACAGAAGPALEGGVASMGMMANPGVIDKVRIDPATSEVRIRTIEEMPPKGICGSGLIDLVAQLYLCGMIDLRGKFMVDRCGERLRDVDGTRQFVLVLAEDSATGHDLALSQTDIDALLRSKAAMYAILMTITGTVNVSMKDIRNFYIAGTFGSYIDPRSAIAVGMVPDLPPERYKPLGNTSLEGATKVLVSRKAVGKIREIRDKVTYVELNVNQEFMNLFSAARFIPHTDRSLFPSVHPMK